MISAPHPLRCETCKRYSEWDGADEITVLCQISEKKNIKLRDQHKNIISIVGCASHPLALQVLARPVIAELELIKSNKFTMVGIDEVIALLKGDAT